VTEVLAHKQERPRRSFATLATGACVGALAGAASALSDYGAHWLFMESARDRLWLALRLLSLQASAGLALGLGAALIVATGDALLRGRARIPGEAALFALLCSPLAYDVGQLLFSGGKARTVPLRALWVGVAASSLIVLALGAWLGFAYVLRWARAQDPRHARIAALALVGAAWLIGKIDQWVLPKLYDYLHGCLSAASFALYALAIASLWSRWRAPRGWLALAAIGCSLLALLGYASLRTLDQNQNVRVALLSPNMPHARSLMLAAGPFLPRVDAASAALARERAAAARERRRERTSDLDLPQLDGAHVLLITIDALRADHLGLHGYQRGVTHEIDALGARGVVFEHAYAQAPHSSYSLCSLMTSEYLHETTELGGTPPTATLPRVLAAAGYHTAAFYTQGIFHTAAEQLGQYENDAFGFALHDHQDRPAEEMTDRALVEIDRTLARGEPSALFWVHYFDVHEPYEATTLGTSDVDRYDSELLATDRAIGRLVREAEKRLHKPLVVVITADHGEEFHDHGGVYHGSSLYEEQVHIPLIVLAPGLPPRRVKQPVESIDIAPTLLGMLGIARPSSMRGTDLRALMLQPSAAERGPVFSAVIHKKLVVSWPYKLIADLRFGSFELYNLEQDPKERDNRADREPARVQSLRGEVYAWLDSLTPSAGDFNRSAQALEWGRLGDRRAVEPLCALLLNDDAGAAARTEAARLLGKLADPAASKALLAATHARDAWVAAEAAIALGRMFDPQALPALRRLVDSEDPGIRSRAAVSLGRLRDRAAVPALIDALWNAPSLYEREEAVRWLGRLGDPAALDALLNLLPEAHTRHLVVVALGELGDTRAFAPLTHVLSWDRNTNVRDGAVRGLAMLGDARALSVLLPLVSEDQALSNTSEALVRLHALERQLVGGVDLSPSTQGSIGFGHCERGPLRHDWDFLHRTSCNSERQRSTLTLHIPRRVAEAGDGNVALISLKRIDASGSAELELRIGDRITLPVRVDGAWHELRFPIAKGALSAGNVRAELRAITPGARVQLDHVLIVPRTPSGEVAARGG
jgi:arylsulfatase A-like enzyme